MKNNKLAKFEELLVNLKDAMEDLNEYAKELGKEQSICDKELIDLEHYTEFLDVDDKEAISIFKEIKSNITRRREIKDVLNNFDAQTTRLAERKYKPRIRVDLFDKLHR